ncbi:hypothetical protein SNE40_013846 [Patella caerulea]|uniref:GON domain-containing protein n=1 Tax=Patella caerulea TaxID=87958 RepID=A0AAN8JJ14_PATCE
MYLRFTVSLAILNFNLYFSESVNTCYKSDVLMGMLPGQRLLNVAFSTYQSKGLMDCCRRCQLHKICSSVNFDTSTSVCELNVAASGLYESRENYKFVDMRSWSSLDLGSCANNDCLLHQRCQDEGNSEHTCVPIGCGSPPDISFINKTSFGGKTLWQFNETAEYACSVGYYPSTDVTCMDNGNWTDFTCKPFRNCPEIKKCYAMPNSNEFWLMPFSGSQMIKVYCRFTEKSRPYITVNELNKSVMSAMVRDLNNSCDATTTSIQPHPDVGETRFQKVRLFVGQKILHQSNQDYASSTLKEQAYGRAGDCYALNDTCGVKGEFVINLTGTGLRVSSSVEWDTWGTDARIEYLNRSDDGLIVNGACGGSCGGCKLKTDLFIEPDPNYIIPDVSVAISPICESLV